MKFLHTGDLHLGKRIFELSLIEDQRYMLEEIYSIAWEEKVDAVVIAGDIYDRAVPSGEAVSLLNEFLTRMSRQKIPVIMISGNHDSPERIAFAQEILDGQGLYIAGDYRQPLKEVVLSDEYGEVHFICMPFVKPAVTGNDTNARAVEQMLSQTPMLLDLRSRYVLVTHYFVVGENGAEPELSDAETDVNVGGLDGVSADFFAGFSYVALGHIHRAQKVGAGNVYYSGSPQKYSFGEAEGTKTVNIVELGEAGKVEVRKRSLTPLHEMRCIRGRMEDLMSREVLELLQKEEGGRDAREDYLQVTLTDTEELIDPIGTLRSVYPNVLQLLFDKNTVSEGQAYETRIQSVKKSIPELFGEFYEMLKGESMDDIRRQVVEEVAREADYET